MGEAEFETAFAEGRKKTIAEAVALTREAATGFEHDGQRLRLVGHRAS